MREDRFADLVRDRLMDADEVRQALGLQSRQAVWDRVTSGKIPEPILKKDRGYGLWDRQTIEPIIGSFNTEVRAA
jgi:predicted DNA-binding transcriptional regulator AlpA